MSGGPPPVPGGRSPEEREAALRDRAARRRGETADASTPDWRAEAQRLTAEAPRRPRRPPGAGPRWARIFAVLFVGLMLLVGAWFALSLFQPFKGDGGDRLRVAVPTGATLGEIGDLLEERGVIASSFFFQTRARISGASGDLKPGSYVLREDMSYAAALDALKQGTPPDVVTVVVPEGRSRREVARAIPAGLRGDYIAATRRSRGLNPREYGAPASASLEGFLFPATYELKRNRPVSVLVEQQLSAFRRNFERVDTRAARRRNLTDYDILIIASMVEREASVAKERPLIASVIYNRLQQGIPLGIDATVRYAVNNWDRPLRQSELNTSSPYNTRKNSGLPPGPIGSPGLASIRAAARPARSDYLFYVVKPGTCGEHAFSATDAEFQRDVAAYERERQARGGKSPVDC